MSRRIFIGAAWPYANNSLHLGHVSALIGADTLARYHRQKGDHVLYVSGSDCYGTPIAIAAETQKVAPAVVAGRYHEEFVAGLIDGLGFSYDLYTTTMTKNHAEVVQQLFLDLYNKNLIYTKVEELPFCSKCSRFLPDRYIEGECPVCHFSNARGDQCDECCRILSAKDLIKPKCKLCGSVPTWRESEHFFLRLSEFQSQLETWTAKSEGWRLNAVSFAKALLDQGLQDRAITRDTTWGVEIPLVGYDSKRIYVWFEAVSGYLSASKEWATSQGDPDLWKKWWNGESPIHYYVHGKDNIPFHTSVWPAILIGEGGLHLPDRIVSSEYLTLEKKQFSKSRNWAVWLPDFLNCFDPETLRYFLTVAGPETSDADFSWAEFRTRINSELIGNFGNFAHRTLSFISNNFPDGVEFPAVLSEAQAKFIEHAESSFESVGALIEKGKFREAIKTAFGVAEHGNRFFNDAAPWESVKKDRTVTEADLAIAGHAIRCLSVLVNPFLPISSERLAQLVGVGSRLTWKAPKRTKLRVASNLKPLYRRIEATEVEEQLALLGKQQ